MKVKFSHFLQAIFILFVGANLLIGVIFEVRTLSEEDYRRQAREIRVTRAWRHGYISAHHGAFLVRTRNTPDFAPIDPHASDSDLDGIMLGELRAYPWKVLLEALFYAGVLTYSFVWVPRMRLVLKRRSARGYITVPVEAACWMIGWSLWLAPLLILDYGGSLYTTWAGPGALGYSGPYLGVPTGFRGETIGYRPIIEFIGSWAVVGIRPHWFGSWIEKMSLPTYLWLTGALFYSVIGAVAGLLRVIGIVPPSLKLRRDKTNPLTCCKGRRFRGAGTAGSFLRR